MATVAGSSLGAFTHVGRLPRLGLAHVTSRGVLDRSWDARSSGSVAGLVRVGGTLYVTGAFDRIGGQSRPGIAALDARSARATSWHVRGAAADGLLAVDLSNPSALFALGRTETSPERSTVTVIRIERATGATRRWRIGARNGRCPPVCHGPSEPELHRIEVAQSTVFVSGQFDRLAGKRRRGLAALDATTGRLSRWNPTPTSESELLAVGDDRVYVSVQGRIGGARRFGAAALDLRRGRATPWNPNVSGRVAALVAAGGVIYLGGDFTQVAGHWRDGLAAVDSTSGALRPWRAERPNWLSAWPWLSLAADKARLLVCGEFSGVGGVEYQGLAALELPTGAPTRWRPRLRGALGFASALAAANGRLYVGGSFTEVNGQPRHNLAAFDLSTGALLPWAPQTNGRLVGEIATNGDDVFLAGDFTTVNGIRRSGLAAVRASDGVLLPFRADLDGGRVAALTVADERIVIGGDFGSVNATPRPGVAVLDAATGEVAPPDFAGIPRDYAFSFSGSLLYILGYDDRAEQQTITTIDIDSGARSEWKPRTSWTSLAAIAATSDTVYLAGTFTGRPDKSAISAFQTGSGAQTDSVSIGYGTGDSAVETLTPSGRHLVATGYFAVADGAAQSTLAVFGHTEQRRAH